jgi:uncharacterized protein YegL
MSAASPSILPLYLVLDTSGSMAGAPIAAVNAGLASLLAALRRDSRAAQTVWLSVLTFDSQARVLLPLSPLGEIGPLELQIPGGGATMLGAAMQLLLERQRLEQPAQAYRPMAFVMTDGKPSDAYDLEQMHPLLAQAGFANLVGLAAGPKAQTESLKGFCQTVVRLDTMDGSGFSQFFQWIGDSVGQSAQTGSTPTGLPPAPTELRLDF